MNIGAVNQVFFTAADSKKRQADGNPVSQKGEAANLTLAAFVGGAALGTKLLFELFDGNFVAEKALEKGEKIAGKNYGNAPSLKKKLMSFLAAVGVTGAGIAAFALLYTFFNIPKIKYNANVNAFKKSKNMDVYIKSNTVEKELYKQMSEKAKTADENEKNDLAADFIQMQAAKTRVPDFVKIT